MLTLPDFFGDDYDAGNPYYGFYVKHTPDGDGAIRHNAAETAIYVGIIPLLLALLTITRTIVNSKATRSNESNKYSSLSDAGTAGEGSNTESPSPDALRGKERGWGEVKGVGIRLFFALLAVLALLLALGTPLNALFYFFIPGFAQSGSPARCLVLWALAIGVLAGLGLDSLLRQPPTKREISVVMECSRLCSPSG